MSVCVLGGYGTFGKLIVDGLLAQNVAVTVVGRTAERCHAFVATMQRQYPSATCVGHVSDVDQPGAIDKLLQSIQPTVLVNTCGPFQEKDYAVAQSCISAKVHYIDLADGREFVGGISALDAEARAAGVAVISGASTVPALSSAVVEHFRDEFSELDEIIYGISPGQQSPRGLATTRSILTYLGRPIVSVATQKKSRYDWQGLYRQDYPDMGKRWMANCDIPDLDLFPQSYGFKRVSFSAGMESSLLHLGMWLCSWCVRMRLPLNLAKHAQGLLRASHWFDRFGSDVGGMHVIIHGKDRAGIACTRRWFIVAKNGDGPRIPSTPAVVLAKQLIAPDATIPCGAMPCVGTLSLADYLAALKPYQITVYSDESSST